MGLPFVFILVGLVLLAVGGEGLVRGGAGLAQRAGVSPLLIGLTVVAFGTSAPEMAVCIRAALGGQGGIAIGNIVGSNIFNILTIIGVAALLVPLEVHRRVIRREMIIMIAVTLLGTWFFVSENGLSRWEGGVLVAGLLLYLILSASAERKEAQPLQAMRADFAVPALEKKPAPFLLSLAYLLGGIALLVGGAQLLVSGAVTVARTFGVSEAVIGLTIVAAGTSLPELATSVVAAFRRETDIALGNVVGSNIFNTLSIGGVTGLVAPVGDSGVGWLDYGVMTGSSVLLLGFMATGSRISRWEGAALLVAQGFYLWALWPK